MACDLGFIFFLTRQQQLFHPQANHVSPQLGMQTTQLARNYNQIKNAHVPCASASLSKLNCRSSSACRNQNKYFNFNYSIPGHSGCNLCHIWVAYYSLSAWNILLLFLISSTFMFRYTSRHLRACVCVHKLIKQTAKTSNSVVDAITVVSGELFVFLRNARDKQQQQRV